MLSLVFGQVLTSSPASAQAMDLLAKRQHLSNISADWRFHAGDDPRWSQPGFDDSSWKVLQPTKNWTAQGYAEQNGLAWFRFTVHVPAKTPSLVLQLPLITKSYELFADGQLIGKSGSLPPERPEMIVSTARIFTVPLHPTAAAQDITLALRLWQLPRIAHVRPSVLQGSAWIGEAPVMLREFSLAGRAALLRHGGDYTEDIIYLVVGIASLLLFWFTRERFYLWFTLNAVCEASNLPILLLSAHFGWGFFDRLYLLCLQDALGLVTFGLFVLGVLHVRSWKSVLAIILSAATAELGLMLVAWAVLPLRWADFTYFVGTTACFAILTAYMVRGWSQPEGKLLLISYVIAAVFGAMGNLGHFLADFDTPHIDFLTVGDTPLLREPFAISLVDAANMLSLLGMLGVLVYRFARTAREQQRLASALQAAHEAQHQLVPVDIPELGGLQTEIAYLAAEEVGGDFCQVLPRTNGSILVAIGDVSGKGLQAAMLGTLAVGALRSLADEDIGPAAVLVRLNQVILRTEQTGFITCLCLSLTPAGEITMANAGHLLPYLNGVEVPLDAGLPLGIMPDVAYEQHTFVLPAASRLTLLSDGVVEARARSGELFGFERTMAISQLRASQIAAQAKQYGQQDDITAITLDWRAAAHASIAA